jgi:hypothetical protein
VDADAVEQVVARTYRHAALGGHCVVRPTSDRLGQAEDCIGTARRKQVSVRPRKLHGLFAEPILTHCGFAGRPSISSARTGGSTRPRRSARAMHSTRATPTWAASKSGR